MLTKRIIPCLDIRDGRVVKGVNFVGIRDAGDPVEAAVRYNEEGADELVLLDINASHEGRKTVYDVVSRVAEQVFIPFTVGGGISDLEQIRQLLLLGADKVSINSPAVRNPDFITEAALRFGSQCIVLAMDVRAREGGWDVYVNGGRVNTGLDALKWAEEGVRRGAGGRHGGLPQQQDRKGQLLERGGHASAQPNRTSPPYRLDQPRKP